MTEVSEVKDMIETISDLIDEITYEAETVPGNGTKFKECLIDCISHLKNAKDKLNLALNI